MSLKRLIEKYEQMVKDGYETVFITQVLNDLRDALRGGRNA